MPLAIKQFRESQKMSQDEFADIIGISKVNYSKKERGLVKFSLNEAYQYSQYFRKPIEVIFGCAEFSQDEPLINSL